MEGDDIQAVLLCAGLGRRLRPLTDRVPKPMLEVGGKTLLDWHLEGLSAAGIRSVILVVGHLGQVIRDHVRERRADGLEIQCVQQDGLEGTGAALKSAGPWVHSPWFCVGYGDVFFGSAGTLWRRLARDPVPKLAGARVEDGGSYGRLTVREDRGRRWLVSITEKDGEKTPGVVNAGAYFLPRSLVADLDRLRPSVRGELELTDAIMGLVEGGIPVEVVATSRWVDAGTPAALTRADRLAKARR